MQTKGRRTDLLYSMAERDPSASEPELQIPDLSDFDPPGDSDSPEDTRFNISRPASIPCEQCQQPLSAINFFVCDRCSQRLCNSHRASPATGTCQVCTRSRSGRVASAPTGAGEVSAMPAPPPPMPSIPATMRMTRPRAGFAETLDEKTSAPWSAAAAAQTRARPNQDFVETDDAEDDDLARPPPGQARGGGGLAAMRFECPYCEEPVARGAQSCGACGKHL